MRWKRRRRQQVLHGENELDEREEEEETFIQFLDKKNFIPADDMKVSIGKHKSNEQLDSARNPFSASSSEERSVFVCS